MLFGKAVKIENCAACHDDCDDYVTREFTWNDHWISMRAQLNNIFFLLFYCKSRNQHQQVAQPGDQEYIIIFGLPKAKC